MIQSIAVLTALLCCASGIHAQASNELIVSLPASIPPEHVTIVGGHLRVPADKLFAMADRRDYPIEVPSGGAIKLLIYCPGYRMVPIVVFEHDRRTTPAIMPVLEPLDVHRIAATLVDTSGRPIKNVTIHLNYSLVEAMKFFSYGDGPVPPVKIGSFTTDRRGRFNLELPRFLEDPFFNGKQAAFAGSPEALFFEPQDPSPAYRGDFQLSLSGRPWGEDRLNPSQLKLQESYPPVLTIVLTQHGFIAGRIGDRFLQQNGVTDLKSHILPGNTRQFDVYLAAQIGSRSYAVYLSLDGSFNTELPPGVYELEYIVLEDYKVKVRAPLESGVVIREGHTTRFKRLQ